MKLIITESQLKGILNLGTKLIIPENYKKGSPEELVGLLELLPVDETAKYISEEIYQDVTNYYQNDISLPSEKKYMYHPKEECLKPYELIIDFRSSNNATAIGYAEENYIQVKVLSKDSRDYNLYFKDKGANPASRLFYNLVAIIKHECSHFYLRQRGVEECLYNTHPDGMKKYYQDRQELVLHSREIFDRFQDNYPNWTTIPIEKIIKIINERVKDLRNHTNINAPFNVSTQKKYVSFILNTYIKPKLNLK